MESGFKEIVRILDEALEGLRQFESNTEYGIEYGIMLENGKDFHSKIRNGLNDMSDILDMNIDQFQQVVQKLCQWNYSLKDLTGKHEMEKEILLLKNISTNGVFQMTNEEKDVLERKIQLRQTSLKKQIYDLINLNVSLQISFEDIQKQMSQIENLNEQSITVLDDIKERYQEHIENEEKQKLKQDMESNPINNAIDSTNVGETVTIIKPEENHSAESKVKRSDTKTMEKKLREEDRYSYKKKVRRDVPNPESWDKFKYHLTGGFFNDLELSYVIQALKGTLDWSEHIDVSIANRKDSLSFIDGHYDVLSNIIRIEPTGLDVCFNPDIPWRISIPYSIVRSPNREVVIFCKDETEQKSFELYTQEMLYEESKDGIKVAEAALPSPNCMCVVVSKSKVEKFEINKKGMTIESKVDDRISILIPPASIMIRVPIKLIVQPIETGLVSELRTRIKSSAMNDVQTISPIVELDSDWQRNLLKPLILQIPIPHPAGYAMNKNRIFSAGPVATEKIDRRPKTAVIRQISNEVNSYIKLAWYDENEEAWKVKEDFTFNLNKNGDSITLDLKRLEKQKIVALRCADDLTEDKIQRALEIIEDCFEDRSIQFIFAQRSDDPNRVILVTGPPHKIERIQKFLLEQGYDGETSMISHEFIVRERDGFRIDFRGNLISKSETEIQFIYNSQLSNRVEFNVQEKDKFSQKNKESFQGYVSIYKFNEKSSEKLWEIVVNIPKIDQEMNKSLSRDFNFKATDVINKEYLNFLSYQIGDDWRYLGYALRIPDESIKRIANDPRQDVNNMAYECLLKWIKNTTVYSNKVEIMERALRLVGRQDLVKDLGKRVFRN